MYCTTLSRRKAPDNFLRFSTVISSILPLSTNDIYDGIQTWMSDNCNWRGNIPERDDNFDETTLGCKDLTYIEWFQAFMTDGTSKWMPDDFKPVKSEFWAGWPQTPSSASSTSVQPGVVLGFHVINQFLVCLIHCFQEF